MDTAYLEYPEQFKKSAEQRNLKHSMIYMGYELPQLNKLKEVFICGLGCGTSFGMDTETGGKLLKALHAQKGRLYHKGPYKDVGTRRWE